MPAETLADRLERLFNQKFDEVNIEEIGRDAGVSAATIRRVLSGEIKSLKLEDGVLLARHLGSTPEELAFGATGASVSMLPGAARAGAPSSEVTKLGIQVQKLVRETKALHARLKKVESHGQSDQAQRRRDRTRG